MIIFYFFPLNIFFALLCIDNWFMSYEYFLFLPLNIFFAHPCIGNWFISYDYFLFLPSEYIFCPLIKILFYEYNFFFSDVYV